MCVSDPDSGLGLVVAGTSPSGLVLSEDLPDLVLLGGLSLLLLQVDPFYLVHLLFCLVPLHLLLVLAIGVLMLYLLTDFIGDPDQVLLLFLLVVGSVLLERQDLVVLQDLLGSLREERLVEHELRQLLPLPARLLSLEIVEFMVTREAVHKTLPALCMCRCQFLLLELPRVRLGIG